jgi:hypothetical protein
MIGWLVGIMVFNATSTIYQKSYIVAVSFIGGGQTGYMSLYYLSKAYITNIMLCVADNSNSFRGMFFILKIVCLMKGHDIQRTYLVF